MATKYVKPIYRVCVGTVVELRSSPDQHMTITKIAEFYRDGPDRDGLVNVPADVNVTCTYVGPAGIQQVEVPVNALIIVGFPVAHSRICKV